MYSKRFGVSALAAFLFAGALTSTGQAAPPSAEGRYVVVLADTTPSARSVASEHSRRNGAAVEHVYEDALKGYSATIRSDQMGSLRSDPRVAYVAPDAIAQKSTTQTPTSSWGLDRVDQHPLPLDIRYTYTKTGSAVPVYILDSGVYFGHSDFAGRAVSGPDYVDNDNDASDCDGHGTHVAGTVGGSSYGIAKQATLVSVRVLDCSGSGYWSWVIKGIDWVTAQHNATKTAANPAGSPAVANMSLGGSGYTAVDDAVKNSIASGVAYSVAAGNNGKNACDYSPARVAAAMTNGASDKYDKKASFSNYGSCVDWYAPGVGIASTTMNGGSASWSGTSMSSPHTAGVAALVLQGSPTASPYEVTRKISEMATKKLIKEFNGAYKDLLFTNL